MTPKCLFVNYCFPVLSDPTRVTIIQCNLLNNSLPKIKRTGMKEHLIKKQLDAHSLKPEQMIISDDIIMEIIQHYLPNQYLMEHFQRFMLLL